MRPICCYLLLSLLVLAACTDPTSDVGLDLLGDSANPNIKTFLSKSFSPSSLVDITGAAPRVLVGAADDPLTGQIEASGFLDFAGKFSGAPSDAISAVQLRLVRDYDFGDTTGVLQFSLHQVLAEWDQSGLKANTALTFGPEIINVNVTTRDTLITVDLPVSWIDANENVLRSDNFGAEFYGFAFINNDSEQVAGFNSASTTLVATSTAGPTTFTVSSTYTKFERKTEPDPPDDLVLFQDGTGPAIALDFDLHAFLSGLSINGAVLTFSADTVASQNTPPNFVRPLLHRLQLVAVTSDPEAPAILVGEADLSDEGKYRFSGQDLSVFFQSVFLGTLEYEYLELRAPVINNGLNTVLLHGINAGDLSPRATFISPQEILDWRLVSSGKS
jgi:hypothetical protein